MTADVARWAAAAAWAGQHALGLYAGSLALLLSACLGSGWLSTRQAPGARETAGSGRALRNGLVVLAVAVALFAATAWQLRANPALSAADAAFLQALQPTVSAPVRQFFAGLTHAADTATLTALALAGTVALLLRRQAGLAAGWALAIAGNGLLNTLLKLGFGRLRPPHLDGVLAEPGLSFPSGHSSGAVAAYGMAAYLALRLLPPRWHLPALMLAAALALSIGASRLVLQVHFPSDVLAGFASGSAWLALCITALAGTRRRPTSEGGAGQPRGRPGLPKLGPPAR